MGGKVVPEYPKSRAKALGAAEWPGTSFGLRVNGCEALWLLRCQELRFSGAARPLNQTSLSHEQYYIVSYICIYIIITV